MNLKKIRRCEVCGSFTMQESHCGKPTKTAHPPKYSPEDKYARYRRIGKGLVDKRG